MKLLAKNVLVFMLLMCLVGCSSDNEDNSSDNDGTSRELLIGTWTIDETDIIFNEDGTGESQVYVYDDSDEDLQWHRLSWRLDSDVLTINFSVTGTSIFQIIEIDNKSMVLQDSNGIRRNYTKKQG
ncbi:hypothetical protein F8C76_10170 [Flagellimonas olearia]|uniref:Lipocalin-like domain-containing protein n=1 Tax=Flagellimonas olearia TaxID=552546 RepID=A0A6I1DY31_9FLAO|nr:hypothetical protein [Allomuricauda olearia]KAB7528227.1 hypothetical protein F8C76_10170 [Allomuricauda olearia]